MRVAVFLPICNVRNILVVFCELVLKNYFCNDMVSIFLLFFDLPGCGGAATLGVVLCTFSSNCFILVFKLGARRSRTEPINCSEKQASYSAHPLRLVNFS